MKTETKTRKSEAAKKRDMQGGAANTATPGHDCGKEQASAGPTGDKAADVAGAIDKAIDSIREKLTSDDLKASISDLVRLIQLRKELTEEGPKQVTVRWVEEWNNSPANEE